VDPTTSAVFVSAGLEVEEDLLRNLGFLGALDRLLSLRHAVPTMMAMQYGDESGTGASIDNALLTTYLVRREGMDADAAAAWLAMVTPKVIHTIN